MHNQTLSKIYTEQVNPPVKPALYDIGGGEFTPEVERYYGYDENPKDFQKMMSVVVLDIIPENEFRYNNDIMSDDQVSPRYIQLDITKPITLDLPPLKQVRMNHLAYGFDHTIEEIPNSSVHRIVSQNINQLVAPGGRFSALVTSSPEGFASLHTIKQHLLNLGFSVVSEVIPDQKWINENLGENEVFYNLSEKAKEIFYDMMEEDNIPEGSKELKYKIILKK